MTSVSAFAEDDIPGVLPDTSCQSEDNSAGDPQNVFPDDAEEIPAETPTPEPTEEAEPTEETTPTPEATPIAVVTPTPEATETPTPEPTEETTPTPEPTEETTPTPEPTPIAVVTPTPEATETPTPEPSADLTTTPTPTPTAEPTQEAEDGIEITFKDSTEEGSKDSNVLQKIAIFVKGAYFNIDTIKAYKTGEFEKLLKKAFKNIPDGLEVSVVLLKKDALYIEIKGKADADFNDIVEFTLPANILISADGKAIDKKIKCKTEYRWNIKKTEAEDAKADEEAELSRKLNQQLIAQQVLEQLPVLEDDFRFIHVDIDKSYFAKKTVIHEYMDDTSRIVGNAAKGVPCYVLKSESGGWLYVESGNVRGFVQSEYVTDADTVGKKNIKDKEEAQETVDPAENRATTYTRASALQTVIDKVYLVAKSEVEILEKKTDDASLTKTSDSGAIIKTAPRVVGVLPKNGLAFLLLDEKDGWYYVESGDVRGYVKKTDLYTLKQSENLVNKSGESTFTLAEESMEPEDNASLFHTITSVKKGTVSSAIRNSIITCAASYVGNPYVWGGTDPVNGADCSGFVQTIYSWFGYYLPRVAENQAYAGTMITLDSLQPGDLVFFAEKGQVTHVGIYAGNGYTIEAANENVGIVYRQMNTVNAVWGVRVVPDDVTDDSHLKASVVNTVSEISSYEKEESVAAEDVTVKKYLDNKNSTYWLILCKNKLADNKTMLYDGELMYWSDVYGAFCYLVETKHGGAKPVVKDGTVKIQSGIREKITYDGTLGRSSSSLVKYDNLIKMIASGSYDPEKLDMKTLLCADLNGDKSLTVSDAEQ